MTAFFSPMVIPILRLEQDYGHELIEEAPWLRRDDWNTIVVSQDGNAIRMVLLDAKEPGKGAMTRLITGILTFGHVPIMVQPMGQLREWCKKQGWKRRIKRYGNDHHEIWIYRAKPTRKRTARISA